MELYEMTASEAIEAIRQKKIKARELTESVLSRLASTDNKIKAFITVTADVALRQADAIDRMVSHNEPLPPLAGVPIALKDDLCLEGVPTTSGSKILESFPAPYSATVVEKTIEAGGVIIGKTNMDEFGMGDSTETSFFQITRNPLENNHVAGDGTAAAVACGQSLLGIGSDSGGGLRVSASYCGVAGLRPTPGLISRYGLSAFASSMSQVGFLAKKAGDFRPLLDAATGFDPRDSSTSVCPTEKLSGNTEGEKIKVGYPEDIFSKIEGSSAELLDESRNLFSSSGYELKKVSMPHFTYGLLAYYVIANAESFSNLSRYDGIRYGYYYEGENLEEWYRKSRRNGLGEEARRRSVIGAHLLFKENFGKYYEKALQVWSLVKDDFNSALQDCDMLLLPVTGTPVQSLDMKRDFTQKYAVDEFCAPVSLAGLPSLSLPVGESEGLPLGIQLVGSAFSEKMLINVAINMEKEVNYLVSPVV